MKTRTRLFLIPTLVLGLALPACSPSQDDAGDAKKAPAVQSEEAEPAGRAETSAPPPGASSGAEVQIRIGTEGTLAKSPDLNLSALRSGRTTFTVVNDGTSYGVELTADEVADLLSGSTVLVEASSAGVGHESVQLSLAKPESKDAAAAPTTGAGW